MKTGRIFQKGDYEEIMERLYGVCCGIDVHKKILVACLLRHGKKEIQNFGTTTRELLRLADWLIENECEMTAMESTGSYWKPLYNVLEDNDLKAMVVNAQHMKAVPGRKTDVKDSEWIADLLLHGLLRGSYIPDRNQREMRELCGYRKSLIRTRAAETNRLQKMLEGANVKLSGTVSDINGKSAKTLLDLSLTGEIVDEELINQLKKEKKLSKKLKASPAQLADDLLGVYTPLQIKMIKELRLHIEELNKHIEALNDDIDHFMDEDAKECKEILITMPGIGEKSAEDIISVIGTDMGRFPDGNHLSSWGGIAPGNHESAGKKKSSRITKGNKLLKATIVQCAQSAVHVKDSYLKAFYDRLKIHRGKKRAIVAVAHSMLNSIYYMLLRRESYKELGADYFNQFNREKKANSYKKKLESLGFEVVLQQA